MTNNAPSYYSVEIEKVDLEKLDDNETYTCHFIDKKWLLDGITLKSTKYKTLSHILLSHEEYKRIPESGADQSLILKPRQSPDEFLREKYNLVDFYSLHINGKSWLELMKEYSDVVMLRENIFNKNICDNITNRADSIVIKSNEDHYKWKKKEAELNLQIQSLKQSSPLPCKTADSKYPEVKEGKPFICDGRMYMIKMMDIAGHIPNLENGQSIFVLSKID